MVLPRETWPSCEDRVNDSVTWLGARCARHHRVAGPRAFCGTFVRMTAPSGVCDVDRVVSENLRAILARRRIAAVTLAPAVGIHERPLRRRLRGEIGWTIAELLRVAEALDVEVGDLMTSPEPVE